MKETIKSVLVGVGVHFERIRRITGYLVGDLSRWNNAKKAEEKDRVKHMRLSLTDLSDWQEKDGDT